MADTGQVSDTGIASQGGMARRVVRWGLYPAAWGDDPGRVSGGYDVSRVRWSLAVVSTGQALVTNTTAGDHASPATVWPVFGQLVAQPCRPSPAAGLPPYERFGAVMALPFKR